MNKMRFMFIIKNPAYLRNRRIYNKCGIFSKSFMYEREENFVEILKCDIADLVQTEIAIGDKKYWAIWDGQMRNKYSDIAIAEFYNGTCKKYISGNVIICGKDGENCVSLTEEEINQIANLYRNGFIVCNIADQTRYIACKEKKEDEKE